MRAGASISLCRCTRFAETEQVALSKKAACVNVTGGGEGKAEESGGCLLGVGVGWYAGMCARRVVDGEPHKHEKTPDPVLRGRVAPEAKRRCSLASTLFLSLPSCSYCWWGWWVMRERVKLLMRRAMAEEARIFLGAASSRRSPAVTHLSGPKRKGALLCLLLAVHLGL